MTENNSQLSVAQLQEIRTAVLGAAAKAPWSPHWARYFIYYFGHDWCSWTSDVLLCDD